MPVVAQRFIVHGFETAVAVAWFLVGISYIVNPGYTAVHSTIGRDLAYWQWIWSVMYVVAGPAVIYGLYWRKVEFRIAGLLLLASGLSIQFVAACTVVIQVRTFTFLTYALVCYLKLIMLRGVYMKGKAYEI